MYWCDLSWHKLEKAAGGSDGRLSVLLELHLSSGSPCPRRGEVVGMEGVGQRGIFLIYSMNK